MKRISIFFTALFAFLSVNAQDVAVNTSNKANAKASPKKTMTWTTKSEAAKELASEAATHLMNVEHPLAYQKLFNALKLDPDFTIALTFMANLSAGEVRKKYAEKALKSAKNKTEGEKLFASMVDPASTADSRRDTWDKLHTLFPDGSMIGHFYVVTRNTPEERFAAAQNYIKQFPENAAMYNTIAYYYMLDKKDMAAAKKHFDKYMTLHPDGPNAYDSMGEYYLLNGDKENAKKYYTMALEKYPFFNSATNALDDMAAEEKKMEAPKNADKVQ